MSATSIPVPVDQLAERIVGPVFVPGELRYADEVASFNLAIEHRPDFVAGVTSIEDIRQAVLFASEHRLPVSIHGGRHSAEAFRSGLMISTSRMDTLAIDPGTNTARIGAGVRWGDVVQAAAVHGLHPITGSSPLVGVVGYLLGGGFGPLGRSHGVGSDYLEEATVVTGTGEVLVASAASHPDLFWALRGGKKGLGVVAEVVVRLVPLSEIVGGSITFDGAHMEAVLSGWLDWTRTAHPDVTTSLAALRFPDLPLLPDAIRGRHLVTIHFAWPGDPAEGETIAAPLRALAPVELDDIRVMAASEIARVHNDPVTPGPLWLRGCLLRESDHDLATAILGEVGPDRETPFNIVEIRHLGGAIARDVEGGSAVSGRHAAYALGTGALNPATFAEIAPAASRRFREVLRPWTLPEFAINFLGTAFTGADLEAAWPQEIRGRLQEVRRRVDPDGLFVVPEHVTMTA